MRAALDQLARTGMIEGPAAGSRRKIARQQPAQSVLNQTILIITYYDIPAVSGTFVGEGWDPNIIIHAMATFCGRGLHTMTIDGHGLTFPKMRELLNERPCGVLVAFECGEHEIGRAIIEYCQTSGIPVVTYGYTPDSKTVLRLAADHAEGTRLLTEWALAQGRQRPVLLWQGGKDTVWMQHREEGYVQTMQSHGLEPEIFHAPSLDRDCRFEVDPAPVFKQESYLLAGYLADTFGDGFPDAMLVASDPFAFILNAALRILGKEPNQQVLVLGYDHTYTQDVVHQRYEPTGPAATVDRETSGIGRELASLLLRLIDGEELEGQLLHPPILKVC